jgi:hydroxymethylbilane synthase
MTNEVQSRQRPIRIGSRGSQLALWQANHILYGLRDAGYAVELEVIRTTGDRMQQPGFIPPPGIDGKGIFIKEIEEALEAGRIDLAVHSLKDLPTTLPPQFTLAAIPKRADARDVWVCEQYWGLHTLPEGGRIGTTSPRRRAQLLALRPDVTFVEIRGNIDTRLKKLASGACDALVLAAAGLDRLKRAEWVHSRFSPEELCPAPGQGALALETRAEGHPASDSPDPERDAYIRNAVAFFNHPQTRFCVETERVALDTLGGGCQLPVGVHVVPVNDSQTGDFYRIFAQVVAADGETMVQLDQVEPMLRQPSPETLGNRIAEDLKARGALDLLRAELSL